MNARSKIDEKFRDFLGYSSGPVPERIGVQIVIPGSDGDKVSLDQVYAALERYGVPREAVISVETAESVDRDLDYYYDIWFMARAGTKAKIKNPDILLNELAPE